MELVLEKVRKRYENTDSLILDDINLSIHTGEFVCLLGPSGCGKSTLLNLIAGLDRLTEGIIRLNGQAIQSPGPDRIMMFQEAALFPWLNVIDNVTFGMKIAGVSKEVREEKAKYYLELVRLLPYQHYRIHQLSGGMRQRAALARALMFDSQVMLMDEPFAALDKQTKNLLRDELERIWLETKKTIIYVTHSVEEALFFGDRVIMMSTHPGMVKKEIPIHFPRPRHVDADEFVHLRASILNELRDEVEKDEKMA